MTVRQVSVQDAAAIIAAVGLPLVQTEDFEGGPDLLSSRLSEIAEAYASWRFDEAQNTDIAVARAASDVSKKAAKLLSSIGGLDADGVPIRSELGKGSLYSRALLSGGDDPGRNLVAALREVERLSYWASETLRRATSDMERKAHRKSLAEAIRSTPDDRLLWQLAKTYSVFWNRKPGYSTPDASADVWHRDGPFIRFLGQCMPMFGIELSADGYRQRWSRLLKREAEEG